LIFGTGVTGMHPNMKADLPF